MFKKIIIIGCAFIFGCSTMQPRPMIYPGDSNYDPAQYQRDLAMCESWAERAAYEGTASVAEGAVTGGVGGAVVGTILGTIAGAFLGDAGAGAGIGAALGGAQGAMRGAAYSAVERESRRKKAVLLCLKNHGYEATY